MTRPLALIGFVYLVVQAVSIYFGTNFAFMAAGCFALLFFITLFITKLRNKKVIPIACLVAAIALSIYAGYNVWKIEPLREMDDQDAVITGTLCELPYHYNDKFYYTLRIDEIEISGMEHTPNPQKIIMSAKNALDLEPYGRINCNVHLFTRSDQEDGFSSRQYDYSKGVHMRAFMYEYQGYSITPTTQKPPYYYALQVKSTMMQSLDRLLPKDEAGIIKAVMLGDKTGLTEKTKSEFSAAGAYHLLVVSGLHMSIVFMGLFSLLKFCKIPHKAVCILTAFGVLCFMAITGFTPTVMRSGLMCILYLIALLFNRKSDSLNSLGFAVLVLCAVNPYAAADMGFLLSVTSCLSLILLSKPIRTFFNHKTRRIKYGKRFICGITSSVSASLAVSAGTMPIFVTGYIVFSVIGFIANLFMIFPTEIMLPLAALAALFESIPTLGFLAKPFALLAGLIAKYLIFVAHWLSKIPFATLSTDYDFVKLWLAMAMLLLAIAIFLAKRKILVRTVLTLSSILLLAGIFSYQLANRSNIRISVIDVQDGLSVVVTDHHQTAVIGCDSYSDLKTYQYLRGHGVDHIDYMQPVTDKPSEYKNLADINEEFSIKNLLLPKGQYFAASLEKSLEEVDKISYYEKSAITTLNDDITIKLHETPTCSYTLLKIKDITVLILSTESDSSELDVDLNQIDLLITDKVPKHAENLPSFITILSMDRQTMADSAYQLDANNVRLYATAGMGNLHIDVQDGRKLKLRRGSGG